MNNNTKHICVTRKQTPMGVRHLKILTKNIIFFRMFLGSKLGLSKYRTVIKLNTESIIVYENISDVISLICNGDISDKKTRKIDSNMNKYNFSEHKFVCMTTKINLCADTNDIRPVIIPTQNILKIKFSKTYLYKNRISVVMKNQSILSGTFLSYVDSTDIKHLINYKSECNYNLPTINANNNRQLRMIDVSPLKR